MKIIDNPLKENWQEILKRPTQTFANIESVAKEVFDKIRREGDAALSAYTARFDQVSLKTIKVSENEIERAVQTLPDKLKQAIQAAKINIETFHKAQKTNKIEVETTPGVLCWQEKRPIQKVGLYIPGGTAPLFSTILMLAVPAQIAGCKEIILC